MSQGLDLIPISEWGMGLKSPLIIAGPCSAETSEQMDLTLEEIAQIASVQVFRAGIWKPRTRPNSFEGVGSIGLPWLKNNGTQHNRPVTAEVANVKHVAQALEHGVDILWIGARTTVNPFAVQEIADALKGVDIPVLVKNPINPDLALWIGAIERLNQSGIQKLGAIHRGFSSYAPSKYRNNPMWEIPIELRRRFPSLPILCDPSHICGNRTLLADVSQKAMDLNFDGLMIESHIHPDEAWSDAQQQLTPTKLAALLSALVIRQPEGDDPSILIQLERLRLMIDEVDHEVLRVIRKRMDLVEEVGHLKKAHNISIFQAERWRDIWAGRMEQGESMDLGEDFLFTFLQAVHHESIRTQAKVMNTPIQ